MILQIYSILLVVAFIATGGVLWVGSQGGVGSMRVGSRMGIVLSAGTFLLWGLLAIESFEIVTMSGGSEFSNSYSQLAWLCAGGAMISLLSMFQASVQEIKDSGGVT